MQVLVQGDVRVEVDVTGVGNDAIVFIHGFPLSRAIWDAQVRALSDRFKIVALDLRGMGASSVVDGPYLMESLAGDVAAVLDHLAIERATLIGHSLGGYVALAFARMYAERLRRLALVASRITADTAEAAQHRRELADDAEKSGSSARIVAEFAQRSIGETARREHPEIVEKFKKIAEKNDPRGLAAMLRGMALRDSAEDIAGDLEMPVLVVTGDEDAIVSASEASVMASAFPAGGQARLAASGHLPMFEAPEELSACLATWLSSAG